MGRTTKDKVGQTPPADGKLLKRVKQCQDVGGGRSKARQTSARTPIAKNFDSFFVDSLSKLSGSSKSTRQKIRKKNRIGQNARRRQWELLYQGKAHHLKRKNSAAKQGGSKEIGRPKAHQTKTRLASKEGDNESALHPSWEASKRKKLLNSVTFQGQRTVFADSDHE